MKLLGDHKELNVKPEHLPLFEAMKARKVVQSVTLMNGTMNAEDSTKDRLLENFTALEYWKSIGSSYDSLIDRYVDQDYIETNKGNFYMTWVRKFTH